MIHERVDRNDLVLCVIVSVKCVRASRTVPAPRRLLRYDTTRHDTRQVQAEMKKKNKGKGLSVLSGRALYDYDANLFVVSQTAGDE